MTITSCILRFTHQMKINTERNSERDQLVVLDWLNKIIKDNKNNNDNNNNDNNDDDSDDNNNFVRVL